MKKRLSKFIPIIVTSLLIISCQPSSKKAENQSVTEEDQLTESVDDPTVITLTKSTTSPKFPKAILTKTNLDVTAESDSLYKVDYTFSVENFELRVQTADAANKGIANSGEGQHIHFIVNNGPYTAHYMPDINDKLAPGNYVVLAFLSRSYHESVKAEGAFHIENLTVGDVKPEMADLSAPHLFYSRPKGTYKGKDTEKLLLDFYILNTELSPDGNKIKATINGDEFMIDEWAPHYIEGLPMGEVTITLELIDAEGNLIEGPFNRVTRSVTLEK